MKLITLDQFQVRFGFKDIESINIRLSAAIDAATLHLESVLQTSFDLLSNSDIFFIDQDILPWSLDGTVKFKLSNGFALSTPTPVITQSVSFTEFATGDVIDTNLFNFKYEKGLFILTSTGYNKSFYKIDYDSGFSLKSSPYGQVFVGIPDWLTEAAYLFSNHIYQQGRDCGKNVSQKHKIATDPNLIIQNKIRFFPSAYSIL
jgi:hypothetical protein